MIDPAKYFDHNATTPICGEARDAWLRMSDQYWENPSSLYREAGDTRRMLDDLREEMAAILGISDAERLVFTSGATEANNSVIQHWSQNRRPIAFSSIEHPCVRAAAAGFFGPGRIVEIGAEPSMGIVDVENIEAIIAKSGGLAGIAVMAANNETGAIQPWDDIAEICARAKTPFLVDAAQWFGKEPTRAFANSQVDYFSGSAHKFGGPKGVGFLVIPEDFDDCDFIGQLGGPQENGRRGGTEDIAGIAAMIAALKASAKWRNDGGTGRDAFEQAMTETGEYRVIGKMGPRLSNTSMIVVPHSKNLKWLTRLSQKGFCVSTGSACSSGMGNPSQVMMAMELGFEEMGRVLRISGGPTHEVKDWLALSVAIKATQAELEG